MRQFCAALALVPALVAASGADRADPIAPDLQNSTGVESPAPPEILSNGNRRAAGRLRHGVLTIRLEASTGIWRPEAQSGPGRVVHAFAEEGRAPQIPGPLLRVHEGVEIHATIKNLIPGATLKLYGMATRPADPNEAIEIPPGAVREVRFKAGAPGTYYYWGTTTGVPLNRRFRADSQLTGAFLVEPPGAAPPDDEVMILGEWLEGSGDLKNAGEATDASLVINGLSWPHTERLTYKVGQPVRWRVINGSFGNHPMHLHGFYYSIESMGDGARDTIYATEDRRRVVTELLPPGGTMSLTWIPERPGNWLFHCHILAHISPELRLLKETPSERRAMVHQTGHDPNRAMAGLVVGIEVLPGETPPGAAPGPEEARKLRLFVQSRPHRYGADPGFGYVLMEGPGEPMPDTTTAPSPPIVLTRGEPVSISIFNRLEEETSVHWHGIELESYYDGVPGWSGISGQVTPPIRPGQSLEARFIPPRAGTFIYHTHSHDERQLSSGLYGPLVVLEPGQTFDPAVDKIILLGGAGPESGAIEVNGSTNPEPLVLRAGVKHRFRLINITPNFARTELSLLTQGSPVEWRAIAKDGADLPESQARMQPARQMISVGETYDFEFQPAAPGDLRLEVLLPRAGILTSMVVRVQ